MDMSAALDEYLLAKDDLSPSTKRWYTQKLRALVAWCAAEGVTEDLMYSQHVPGVGPGHGHCCVHTSTLTHDVFVCRHFSQRRARTPHQD